MIPFHTTPEQVMNLAVIMVAMGNAGLDRDFIVRASELARTDQGVYDLMAMWFVAGGDDEERAEIVADIQESLDDYREAPPEPLKKPYIDYSNRFINDLRREYRLLQRPSKGPRYIWSAYLERRAIYEAKSQMRLFRHCVNEGRVEDGIAGLRNFAKSITECQSPEWGPLLYRIYMFCAACNTFRYIYAKSS